MNVKVVICPVLEIVITRIIEDSMSRWISKMYSLNEFCSDNNGIIIILVSIIKLGVDDELFDFVLLEFWILFRTVVGDDGGVEDAELMILEEWITLSVEAAVAVVLLEADFDITFNHNDKVKPNCGNNLLFWLPFVILKLICI